MLVLVLVVELVDLLLLVVVSVVAVASLHRSRPPEVLREGDVDRAAAHACPVEDRQRGRAVARAAAAASTDADGGGRGGGGGRPLLLGARPAGGVLGSLGGTALFLDAPGAILLSPVGGTGAWATPRGNNVHVCLLCDTMMMMMQAGGVLALLHAPFFDSRFSRQLFHRQLAAGLTNRSATFGRVEQLR